VELGPKTVLDENLMAAAEILGGGSVGNGAFSMSVYPDSQPCFGAGDTPANGEFSFSSCWCMIGTLF
jgi:hypothetical protein